MFTDSNRKGKNRGGGKNLSHCFTSCFLKKAFCLLSPSKQMLFLNVSNENIFSNL